MVLKPETFCRLRFISPTNQLVAVAAELVGHIAVAAADLDRTAAVETTAG